MKYQIVIADDEERIVRNMRQIIEEAFGEAVTVDIASNGVECIGLIKEKEIDFLITDICMPGINGIELVKTIRENNHCVQILVISAYEDFQYARELIPYHVLEYLVKPIRVDQILSIIKNAMKKPKIENCTEIQFREESYHVYHTQVLIQEAKNYIKEQLYQPISLVDVAEYLHVNKSYLSTVFKNNTGENISIYINNEKVKEAKKLLLETELLVTEIAEKLGYNTTKYFIEKFSKSTGITPAKYRSLLNGKIK